MYLLIENKGVAPIEAFTLLGDSGTRNCGVSGVIGQFGSGTKHAINLLLRKGIEFHIYSGKTRLEFFCERTYIKDANGDSRETQRVKCRLSGDRNKTIDCGWVLDFGALDWRETSMALREFVSNAIDCSKIMGGEPTVKIEPKRRARSGYTRVFVSLRDPDVSEFNLELSKHFLQFSSNLGQATKKFLNKNPYSVGPRIYREGVFIREINSKLNSVFDYNFSASEIEIDECRNSNEYNLRAAISTSINNADKDILAQLFEEINNGDTYEGNLDEFYLGYYRSDEIKEAWVSAWKEYAGDAIVASPRVAQSSVAEHARAKGFRVVPMPSVYVATLKKMGVKCVASVIGSSAAEGLIECEATKESKDAVDTVWSWLSELEMTNGKGKPGVKSFKQIMEAESSTHGFYKVGTKEVHIREDIGGDMALKVALEEVGHFVTGANDGSRDFQNFFIETIVEALK